MFDRVVKAFEYSQEPLVRRDGLKKQELRFDFYQYRTVELSTED